MRHTLIELQLTYNVEFVSVVQQSDSVAHTHTHTHTHVCVCVCVFFFRFFFLIGYYKVWNIVLCAI